MIAAGAFFASVSGLPIAQPEVWTPQHLCDVPCRHIDTDILQVQGTVSTAPPTFELGPPSTVITWGKEKRDANAPTPTDR